MVMRLGPGLPKQGFVQLGLRTGPRLNAPQLAEHGETGPFEGDARSIDAEQWGILVDGAVTLPVDERLAVHLGVQGEFVGLPMPGYGLYAGMSYYLGSQKLGLAPALAARGASDFGLGETDSTSSLFGLEASCALTVQPEPGMSLGLVPFYGVQRSLVNPGSQETAHFYGAVVAAQVSFGEGRTRLELSGGYGRARAGGISWNAPLAGVRGGR
jgi:hypothetical protein